MAIEGATGPAQAPKQEPIGAQLNRMAGVQTEKNLYDTKDKMGKDAFLKMFTEQLKNQDPLNPVKNEQFSQQMATFSQLEQQIQTNKNLEKMISQQSNTQIAALQLVGKTIQADKAAIYHEKDKFSTITFKLPQDATDLHVEVLDGMGEKLKSINVGPKNQGEVSLKWDGNSEEGRPVETGRYSYRIVAKGVDGKDVTVPSKIDGRVNGITTEKGVTFLLVGDQKVGLSDVETIKESTPENKAASTSPTGLQGIEANKASDASKAPGMKSVDLSEKSQEKTEKQGEEQAQILSAGNDDRPSLEDDDRSLLGDKNLRSPFLPIMSR